MELLDQTATLKLVKVIFSPCLSNCVSRSFTSGRSFVVTSNSRLGCGLP
jgi:hypothetical protein